jgi:hypothetical protein
MYSPSTLGCGARSYSALKWADVDLDNATVRVRRTLTRTDNGRRLALGELKTRISAAPCGSLRRP